MDDKEMVDAYLKERDTKNNEQRDNAWRKYYITKRMQAATAESKPSPVRDYMRRARLEVLAKIEAEYPDFKDMYERTYRVTT